VEEERKDRKRSKHTLKTVGKRRRVKEWGKGGVHHLGASN